MTGCRTVAILCAVLLSIGSVPPRAWAQNGAPSKKTAPSNAKKSVKTRAAAKTALRGTDETNPGDKAHVKKSSASVEGDTLAVDSSTETGNPPADSGEQEENGVKASTGTTEGINELNAALGDMNYKLEIMQERYLKLNQDIEELHVADRDQRRLFNEQVLRQVDPKKIYSIEAEIAVIRSDLAQAREEIALVGKEASESASRGKGEQKGFNEIIRSPWVAVSALGLSLIAILVRH